MDELKLPGPDAAIARQRAREILVEFESDIDGLVDDAQNYVDNKYGVQRTDALALYYRDTIESLGEDLSDVDKDQTLTSLVVCVWLLAEARKEAEQLRKALPMEGNRRAGPPA